MIEWQFEGAGRKCACTGREFIPGDKVASFLYLGEDGTLCRADILSGETGEAPPEEARVARWEWQVRDRLQEREEARARAKSLEEFFLSLFESDGPIEGTGAEAPVQEHLDLLKYLLSLHLERRRLLRLSKESNHRNEVLSYRHLASGREFEVRTVPFSPKSLAAVEEHLGHLIS